METKLSTGSVPTLALDLSTNSVTIMNYDNCYDTFLGLPCKDPSIVEEAGTQVRVSIGEGFHILVDKSDIENCQEKLKHGNIRQVYLDVLDSEWQDCYFWIDSDEEFIFKMYLWPTSWLGFSAHKDGWSQYSNSLYDVATFLENTKKDINEYFLKKTLQ